MRDSEKPIKKRAAAQRYGVSRRTINGWMKNSNMPYHKTGEHGHPRFYASELDKWDKSQPRNSAPSIP